MPRAPFMYEHTLGASTLGVAAPLRFSEGLALLDLDLDIDTGRQIKPLQ